MFAILAGNRLTSSGATSERFRSFACARASMCGGSGGGGVVGKIPCGQKNKLQRLAKPKLLTYASFVKKENRENSTKHCADVHADMTASSPA